MKVLIPIFPKNTTEETLLCQNIEGIPLCLSLAAKLHNYLNETLFLITDSSKVFDQAKAMGMNPNFIHGEEDKHVDQILPFGTLLCLEYLCKTNRLNRKEPVIVVNYRYPLLTQEMLTDIYCFFSQSNGMPVLGMKLVTDHPAQMESYYRTLSLDTLVLVDSNFDYCTALNDFNLPSWHDAIATRPFYLNWLGFGIMGSNKVYIMVSQGKENCMMVPAKRQVENEKKNWAKEYFIYLEPTLARKIFKIGQQGTKNVSEKFAGIPAFFPKKQFGSLLLEDTKKKCLHLYINASFSRKGTEFRIWPFHKGRIQPEKGSITHGVDYQNKGLATRHLFGAKMTGPILTLKKNTVDGYILAILQRCNEQGSADFSEPLQVHKGNYKVNPTTYQRTNTDTNNLITGYQELPAIYEPCNAVTIFNAKDAIKISKMLSHGQTMGFPIDSNLACKVDSEMGMIKLNCQMGAQEVV